MTDHTRDVRDTLTLKDTEHTRNKDPLITNYKAVSTVASAVQSTLGPRGRDKMIEQSNNDVLITNDASIILTEISVEEAAARLVIEIAETFNQRTYDGTTTAVLLIGELIDWAVELRYRGLHPLTIVRGYNYANQIAQSELDDLSIVTDVNNKTVLKDVARTAITRPDPTMDPQDLADLIVSAVSATGTEANEDHVQIVARNGWSADKSTLVDGAVIEKDPVRESMPCEIKNANILLTRDPIELSDINLETQIEISDTEAFNAFLNQENEEIRAIIDHIINIGTNVVLCSSSISDEAQSVLNAQGILAVRRINEDTLTFVARVVDGSTISNLNSADKTDLGHGTIRRDDSDELFIVKGTDTNEQRVTILLNGLISSTVNELEHQVQRILGLITETVTDSRVAAGGGATEVELARRIDTRANSVDSREQLAIQAFADALETVPHVLATNAGCDPIDMLTELRNAHDVGDEHTGVSSSGVPENMFETGVVDSTATKQQALNCAVETATLLIRIDDIFSTNSE